MYKVVNSPHYLLSCKAAWQVGSNLVQHVCLYVGKVEKTVQVCNDSTVKGCCLSAKCKKSGNASCCRANSKSRHMSL
jgi:hypothetical protein